MEWQMFSVKIKEFCSKRAPHSVRFNSFGHFGNHTFFIAPTIETLERFASFLKHFEEYVTKPDSLSPHISIARGLHKFDGMQKTKEFFANRTVDFSFECDGLTLRKFKDGQFSEIAARFPFGSIVDVIFLNQTSLDF